MPSQVAPVLALEAVDGRSVPDSLWQAVPCHNHSGAEKVPSVLVLSSLGHKVVLHGTVPGCPSAVGPLELLITVLRIHIVHPFVGLHHVDLLSPGLQAGHAQLSQFFLVGCSS